MKPFPGTVKPVIIMAHRKHYQLWLHVEEISIDRAGEEVDYKLIDDEYLPIHMGPYTSKKMLKKSLAEYDPDNRAISLLISVLTESTIDSEFDKKTYEFLKNTGNLPLAYRPYWIRNHRADLYLSDIFAGGPGAFRYKERFARTRSVLTLTRPPGWGFTHS